MSKCSTCEYAKLDELWGEYKCKKLQHKIYKPEESENCEHYKEKKESR